MVVVVIVVFKLNDLGYGFARRATGCLFDKSLSPSFISACSVNTSEISEKLFMILYSLL